MPRALEQESGKQMTEVGVAGLGDSSSLDDTGGDEPRLIGEVLGDLTSGKHGNVMPSNRAASNTYCLF